MNPVKKVYNLFTKVYAYISFYAPRAPKIFLEFIKIIILNSEVKHEVIADNKIISKNVVILSVYPNAGDNSNLVQIIKYLVRLKISIVLVINRNSHLTNFMDQIDLTQLSVIVRPNIGRDFGAFKIGVEYLNKLEIENFQRVFLINDSCIFPPNFKNVFDEVLNSKSNWGCLYLNYEFDLHAQSFLTWYSAEVYQHKKFQEFWKKYKPFSDRKYSIKKGEVALTRTLIGAGFLPEPILTSMRLEKILNSKNFIYELDYLVCAYHTFGKDLSSIYTLDSEIHRIQFHRCLVETNPSHRLGLVSTEYLGFPLKRDIFKAGFATLGMISKSLARSGMSGSEIELIEATLRVMGSNSTGSKTIKLQRSYGLY